MISPILSALMRRVFEALLNPFFILWCVVMYLLVHIARKNAHRSLRILACLGILGLGLMSTAWLPQYMTEHLERQYTSIVEVDPNIHWVVVLGGGVYTDAHIPANEALGEVSIKRLLEGVRLKRALPAATLILSGGGAKNNCESVGARMDELTAWFNIPPAQRVVEFDSINTADEAMRVQDIVGRAPFYLVTSAVHMPRSMRLFQRRGLNPIAAPCHYTYYWKGEHRLPAYLPNISNMGYTMIAWHEMLGMVWGKIRNIL